MFDKQNHSHTYMSDKAAKRLAKSNEKIAREQIEAQKKAADDEHWRRQQELWEQQRIAEISSPEYQARMAQQEENRRIEFEKVNRQVHEIVENGRSDAFIQLMQYYQQYSDAHKFDSGGEERNEIARAIIPLLKGFVVSADKEEIDLFFTTLDRQKNYIEDFQDDKKCEVFFDHIYRDLEAIGDKAYDLWYEENKYQTTDEDLQAEKEIDELKRDNRINAIIDILNYYPKLSIVHPHGSNKGKEYNPVAIKIIDYLFTFQAPTEQAELEKFLSLLEDNKRWLIDLGKNNPALMIGDKNKNWRFNTPSPYSVLQQSADQVIKNKYRDVTDGLIGERNATRKKKNQIMIAVGVLVLILILLIIIFS